MSFFHEHSQSSTYLQRDLWLENEVCNNSQNERSQFQNKKELTFLQFVHPTWNIQEYQKEKKIFWEDPKHFAMVPEKVTQWLYKLTEDSLW